MEVLQAKRQDENCTGSYSEGVRDQNVEHLVNLCESNNLETQVIFSYSELARILFPVKSTNNKNLSYWPQSYWR